MTPAVRPEMLVVLAAAASLLMLLMSWRLLRRRDRDEIRRLAELREQSVALAAGGLLRRPEAVSRVPLVDRVLRGFPLVRRLKRMLDVSTLPLGAGDFVVLIALAAVAALLTGVYVLGSPRLGLLLGILAVAGPLLGIYHLRQKWERQVAEQLPDAIELITRAMRAGHSLQTGLALVGQELAEPIRGLFKRAHDEMDLGLRMERALGTLAERVGSQDMHVFVTALLIHREVGGDLAEMLDRLAYVIRARARLAGKIRAMTAEGRFSGLVLSIAPAVVLAMLLVINPAYVGDFLKEPTGQALFGVALLLQIVGAILIKRIVNFAI